MGNGWSVIYPEGELPLGGPIKPFMNDAGLVAVEGRIPVVRLRLHIHRLGSPRRFPLFRRGSIEIRFGAPLSFPPGTDYQDATAAIENAVKSPLTRVAGTERDRRLAGRVVSGGLSPVTLGGLPVRPR